MSDFPEDRGHIRNNLLLHDVKYVLSTYDYFGGEGTLDEAISDIEGLLHSTSIPLESTLSFHWTLLRAWGLRLRFERDGILADLQEGKRILDRSIAFGDGKPLIALAFYFLGRLWEAEYEHEGSEDCWHTAVAWYRKAKEEARGNRDSLRMIDEIAIHLVRPNPGLYGVANVSQVTEDVLLVVQRMTDDDPLKSHALSCLARAYRHRWLLSDHSSTADLSRGEDSARQSILLSSHHRLRYRFFFELSYQRQALYLHNGTVDAIRESAELGEKAVMLMPKGKTTHTDNIILVGLAYTYVRAYDAQGRLSDLEDSVKYSRLAVRNIPHGSPLFHEMLGTCLGNHYLETGHLADIDDMLEASQQGLDRCSSTHLRLPHVLENMGTALAHRYIYASDEDDFVNSKARLEDAIEKSQANTTLYRGPISNCLSVLSAIYEHRFKNTRDIADLDRAVEYLRNTISLRSGLEPSVAGVFSGLGALLTTRFRYRSSTADLIEALPLHESVLRLALPDFCYKHVMLWRLGIALRLRFVVHGDDDDFIRSVALIDDALNRAQTLHLRNRTRYLSELADCYEARHRRFLEVDDLRRALEHYLSAAEESEGPIHERLTSAITAARLAAQHGLYTEATKAFSSAVSLLPRTAWLGLDANKRYAKLVKAESHLASDAAVSAIMAHQSEHAVELLDEGRSVLWRSVLDLRPDLKQLQYTAPDLARELLEVGLALEQDDMERMQSSERQAEAQAARRHRTAERWEKLVGSVRVLEGFESFLKPLPFSELRQAASDGPVVLLNVSRYGSHALVLSSSEPLLTVPLPGLDFNFVRDLAYRFLMALRAIRDQEGAKHVERELLEISRQLWFAGMKIVAAKLMNGKHHVQLRRVWWIPTGFLSLLPVHCAGPYEVGHKGIPDLFISSYSTTLSALLLARKPRGAHMEHTAKEVRVLAIGLPQTPGLTPLPSTRAEIQALAGTPSFEALSVLYGPSATISAVTNALPSYNWIHACCHGHWDPVHPLEAGFNLVDGPLTLSAIVQMQLKDADFAFLSACHTARHTAFVPDESLHLVAGMQVAGFKGILGSAWSMADQDGPQLAKRFYHWLTSNGRAPDVRNAAEALHLAIKDLRGMGVPLYRWAPFVHFGI